MNTFNFVKRFAIAFVLQMVLYTITSPLIKPLLPCPEFGMSCGFPKLMEILLSVALMALFSSILSVLVLWFAFGAFKNSMPVWNDGQPHLVKSILIGIAILTVLPFILGALRIL